MASNTRLTFSNAFNQFKLFLTAYDLTLSWPIPVHQLSLFVAFLSYNNRSPSTIKTYISALSYLHKIRDLPDPTKRFIIVKLMEGANRQRPRDIRAPITLRLLSRLIKSLVSVCSSNYETLLFHAAFSLAFFAFLRVGEFTAVSTKISSSRALRVSDIQLSKNGDKLRVVIRESKTDQRGKTYTLEIVRFADQSSCPVRALYNYLVARPAGREQQLFIHRDGRVLTRYQFSALLKKSLHFCEIKSGHFRSHSFRIGAASEAAGRGIPDNTIKSWGRWASNAFRLYIRFE